MGQKISNLQENLETEAGPQNGKKSVGASLKIIEGSKGFRLQGYYWGPPSDNISALVFLSHGFAEHLQWYEELGIQLASVGVLAFGHDHVGHGRSEGVRADINKVTEYTKDVLNHCESVCERHKGKPLFIVGHSMGGMIAIRSVMSNPSLFTGMVLIGPLIQVNPDEVTPIKLSLAKVVASLIPIMPVANLSLRNVTSDDEMRRKISRDPLRYHGGIRARWAMACHEELFSLKEMVKDFKCPFLVLHGEKDKICALEGSNYFYENATATDKKIKVFPGAYHHLYLEKLEVRNEAISNTVDWIHSRLKKESIR